MKKVLIGFGLVFLMVLVAVAITTTGGRDDVVGGVPTRPLDTVLYGNVTFEPPPVFSQALPVKTWVSGDSGVEFVAGHGSVLDVTLSGGNFGVSGHSVPNALAFNSNATNADGSKPRLPAILIFDPPVQNVSMKVGCGFTVGATATIKAFSTSLSKIDQDSITVAAAMQTMTVSSGSANIELLLIQGPYMLVIDDLVF